MHDLASELRRIPLLRSSLNKGKDRQMPTTSPFPPRPSSIITVPQDAILRPPGLDGFDPAAQKVLMAPLSSRPSYGGLRYLQLDVDV
jgi:hypothetical protein